MFRWLFRRKNKKKESVAYTPISRGVPPKKNYTLYNPETNEYYIKTVDGEVISTSNVNLAKVYTSYAYLKRLQKTLPDYYIREIHG